MDPNCICGNPSKLIVSVREAGTSVLLDETGMCLTCLNETPVQEALGALDLTFVEPE